HDAAVADQHQCILEGRRLDAVDEPAAENRDRAAVGSEGRETYRDFGAQAGRLDLAGVQRQRGQRGGEETCHERGMNSWLSKSGSFMRPARQSDFACSMRSRDEDTKFHSMKRSPTGSPPSAMRVEGCSARTEVSSDASNTSILPAPRRWPCASTSPSATYSARSE